MNMGGMNAGAINGAAGSAESAPYAGSVAGVWWVTGLNTQAALSAGELAKTPEDVLFFAFDLSDVHEVRDGGQVVESYSVTVPDGLTASGNDPGAYLLPSVGAAVRCGVWISGGTAGEDYTIVLRATLSDGTAVRGRRGTLKVRSS